MHGDRPLRLATRGSAQARTQSQVVADALMSAHPGLRVELVFVETLGDRTQHADIPLHAIGGQGVFVKEIQGVVMRGEADMAAHSAKDLPSIVADGLHIAAFCRRRDAQDVLIGSPSMDWRSAHPLPPDQSAGVHSWRRFGPTSSSSSYAATSTPDSAKCHTVERS